MKLQVFKTRPLPLGANQKATILEESETSNYSTSPGGRNRTTLGKGARRHSEKLSYFCPSIKESHNTRKIESQITSKKESRMTSKKTLGSSKYGSTLS